MAKRITNSNSLIRRAALIGAAGLAMIAGPALADVKAGVDAWSAGDFNRAVAEWQAPAQSGDADAMFNLAQAYRLGRGVTADVSRAKELYAEAAERGHVKAADNYGLLLFQQGQQRDAMPLIKSAAERGDPRAQYVLGLAHFNADYAEKDWVRAYALLTLAQSSGLPQASKALGQMDQYVPSEDRQKAQLVAREIEIEAGKRLSADLAAVDLATRSPAPAPALAPAPAAAPQVAPQPTRVAAVTYQRPAVQPSAPAPNPTPSRPSAGGKWKVQLGAFGVSGNADRLWNKLSGNPALSGTRKVLVPGGKVTRLQAVGFATRGEASAACASLQRQGQGCIVAKP
ncbi:SPOR domain-containing protein [Erythrobacter crassostreae]|uniref:SPOR domain-containing protein n=1 Tax=Erythrobacter crassostreae TaxID=2828328 RepID=A0A9X1F467_9SPHN|nr:SPOR domain-containing protein [Erythrobacter crassostrea]MBV7259168.1 SPOR domain-containing protein [Erythrobacter crassostrea]